MPYQINQTNPRSYFFVTVVQIKQDLWISFTAFIKLLVVKSSVHVKFLAG